MDATFMGPSSVDQARRFGTTRAGPVLPPPSGVRKDPR
jgi:hypothetical protein